MRFREDINGLRAIAVLSVVFFHYKIPYFTGGYVGVDIFFVISGYLMSVLIYSSLQEGRFSLRQFFWSRVARIVPALLVMLAVTLAFGWLFLEPLTYSKVASNAIYSLYFGSNFAYYADGGYFSAPAEQNWFLHTWSLAIEMQFYVTYAVTLWGIFRCGFVHAAKYIMLVLLLISLALCLTLTYSRPTAAFYMLLPRAWELLLGGFLYSFKANLLPLRQKFAEYGGLLLVASAVFFFDRRTPWPGFGSMIPTLAAALIIASDLGGRSLLTWKPMQLLGRWSYSIYLWHWPIWVGLNYFEIQQRFLYLALAVLVSIGCGWASYHWIEQPGLRLFKLAGPSKARFAAPLSVVGVTIAAIVISLGNGLPFRAADVAAIRDSMDARGAWDFPTATCQGFKTNGSIKTCQVGGADGSDEAVTVVIGDSQAQEWYPRYGSGQIPSNHPIIFATRAGCPPVLNVERSEAGHNCALFTKEALNLALSANVRRVILIAAWSEYFGTSSGARTLGICLKESTTCVALSGAGLLLETLKSELEPELTRLKQLNKQVALVLPLPTSSFSVPDKLAKVAFFATGERALLKLKLSDYMGENAKVREALSAVAATVGIEVVDPIEFMCDASNCPLQDNQGRSLYKDTVHLRPSAVRQHYSFLDPYILF